MHEVGRLVTCDRCNATVFEEYIGKEEFDGGYTQFDRYKTAEGWGYVVDVGDLCPKCMEKWESILHDFKYDYKTERI